jgi:Heterokaryon incompatibility protein (HET)
MDDCLANHEDCKVTLSGNIINEYREPQLPKRVLAINPDTTPAQIRLLATDGLRGNYAALSHCWGPPEKRPLRTTHANLKDHLNDIAFEKLPKSFQDAIIVTGAVGLRFLWIDSLCIVQDDRKDWLEEAAVMGSIYEKARLTIAASAARDSTEGCFRSRRPTQHIVKVPYYFNANTMPSSFYLSVISTESQSPDLGPLSKRGWTLQEWHLSRRTVLFTKGGLCWNCKTICVDERGAATYVARHSEWGLILQDYSNRELTVETDRLIALQGLVNEMQKNTLDRYHAGIWEADLSSHLLWMVNVKADVHGLHTAPSWSWASQPGPKNFPLAISKFTMTNVAFGNMMTENMDIIKLEAPLRQCIISKPCMIPKRNVIGDEGLALLDALDSPEQSMISGRKEPIHYIQGIGRQARQLVGLAALDSEPYSDIHCLFLASSARYGDDPLNHTSRKNKTTIRSVQKKARGEKGMDPDELKDSEVGWRNTCPLTGTKRLNCHIGTYRADHRVLRWRPRCTLGLGGTSTAPGS